MLTIKRFSKIFFPSAAALLVLLMIFSHPLKGLTADIMFKSSTSPPTGDAEAIHLKEGDRLLLGQYLGQPICWTVLHVQNGQALLMCSNVICFKAFAADFDGVAPSDWVECELRVWLNSQQNSVSGYRHSPIGENFLSNDNSYADEPGFLCPENFSPEELSLLASDKNGDRVSLPTRKELDKLSLDERRRSPTASAVKNDDSRFFQLRPFCWYWTRSPIGANTSSVTTVSPSGGFYKSLSTDSLMGVCPTIRLRATELTARGNGSSEAYVPLLEGVAL